MRIQVDIAKAILPVMRVGMSYYEESMRHVVEFKAVSDSDVTGFNKQCQQAIKDQLVPYGRLHVTASGDGKVFYSIAFSKKQSREIEK